MTRYRLARSQLLEAAAHLPARQYGEAIARFHWDGSVNLRESVRAPGTDAIPLALVGGPLPAWQGHVLDAIESAGGRVVLNATEAGERSLGPAFSPEQAPVAAGALSDLLRLLTRFFLDNCVDVFQRPNTRLYDWLRERLAVRNVRGIVLWHYVGCDLWRAEAQPLRETFGLPVLLLDANEAAGDASRQSGRIQAFLESLR
jgi:benzoyl-CoA reductase/2-hydroxyglutaryl-CoA dehydratase subunit BcrC/BadD/HgdB